MIPVIRGTRQMCASKGETRVSSVSLDRIRNELLPGLETVMVGAGRGLTATKVQAMAQRLAGIEPKMATFSYHRKKPAGRVLDLHEHAPIGEVEAPTRVLDLD